MSVDFSRIIRVTNGVAGEGTDMEKKFELFTTDSREINGQSALFVAFKGEKNDAHDYLGAVLEKGNTGALIEDPAFLAANTVLVKSSRKALQEIAKDYRENELKNTVCIGITGSVGKTTAKEMTVKCISCGKTVSYTQGNRNSQVGLPRTVLEVPEGTEAAVFEMGMSLPGEMERIAVCAQPDIVMIINIGTSHIEAFGTREGIRDEKLNILKGLREGGRIIVNGDEPLLADIPNAIKCGIDNSQNQVYAYNIEKDGETTVFDVNLFGTVFRARIGAIGKHMVYDALFAFAAGHLLGLTPEMMCNSLVDFKSVGDRQRILSKDGVRIIADCYNASPESVSAALDVLGGFDGRKIAVLGDMLELGDHSPSLHTAVGKKASEKADMLVCIGEQSKNTAVAFGKTAGIRGRATYGVLHLLEKLGLVGECEEKIGRSKTYRVLPWRDAPML
jgi:UDP-N-acetylmuramoyl-tripeptide--D-alanyl-D-alanine ligase